MNNPKDTNNPVTDLSPQLNAELASKYLMERSLNKSTHYPGCHKVHLECANRVIAEIKTILSKQDAEDEPDDWMCKVWPVRKWLESLGEE